MEARLFTEPLRRLTRKTSRGFEVIDFARDVLGEPLTPWQEWFVIHALELNPDGTYRFRVVLLLIARQNGKSHVGRVVTLWKLYVDGAALVLGVGQDLGLAREKWQACADSIGEVPELRAEFEVQRRTNGDEYFRLLSGARYKISAANRAAGRGLSVDHLDFEELREQRDWLAWAALSKTTNARPRAQIFAYSNAGDDESIVLNHLREAALSGRDPSMGIFEWSAPDGCDLDDWSAIAQANPGLGHTVSEQAIRSALGTDPPAVYRTEVLCQRVDALDSAVDLGAWQACKDPAGSLESVRERVVACLDVAPDGQHVTLTAAAVLADGRVRVEAIAAWPSTNAARFELPGMLERVKAAAVAWFPSGPAAALAPVLRGGGQLLPIPAGLHQCDKPDCDRWVSAASVYCCTACARAAEGQYEIEGHSDGCDERAAARAPQRRPGSPLPFEVVEIKGGTVAEACQAFADLVSARRIVHPGDPLLDAHVAGAQKLRQGDGWRFVRRGAGHVDGAYAAAGAVHTALTLPVKKPLPRPMVV